MKTLVIDCRRVRSEAEFWAAYVDAVRPEGENQFGRNLDAFWDAVSAGGPGWPGECELHFTNTLSLASIRQGELLAALRKIAADSRAVRIFIE